jgi:hypothetical protein
VGKSHQGCLGTFDSLEDRRSLRADRRANRADQTHECDHELIGGKSVCHLRYTPRGDLEVLCPLS